MNEETIIGPLCGECGAKIRPDSLFCYNCGGNVNDVASEETNGADNKDTTVLEVPTAKSKLDSVVVAEGEMVNGPGRLPTRNRQVRRERKPVEVVWRRSDGPGYWFLLVAVTAAAIVLTVLGIAYYLK